MKKLGLLVMPLMAVSLLASCGNNATKIYHIKFTNGNEIVSEKDYKENEEIIAPKDPEPYEKDYKTYTFDAWYDGDSKFEKGTKATKNAEYVAKFNEVDIQYDITYVLGDEAAVDPGNPTTYIVAEKVTLKEPTLSGFTFKGWYLGANESDRFQYQEGWESGEMTGNLTLYADWHTAEKTLNDHTWDEINDISNAGNASKYFDIGETKKVWLIHQFAKYDTTYQTVRIIGFNQDYTELPEPGKDPDPDKAIGITFEFADLISDVNGLSLATYWNDTATEDGSNYNYKDSTIRKALNSTAYDSNWFRYYGGDEDTEGTGKNRHFAEEADYEASVLDMLPSDLMSEGVLKTASKYININDGNGWKEETINDKLFLLSPAEMGKTGHENEEAHTTTYSYYKGADDNRRIKHQVSLDVGARTSDLHGRDLDGKHTSGAKYSYAGYDSKLRSYYGGYSWLRSPNTGYTRSAWFVRDDGYMSNYNVYYSAYGVAPAFCI